MGEPSIQPETADDPPKDILGLYLLGKRYLEVDGRIQEGLKLCLRAAAAGNVEAMVTLGECYLGRSRSAECEDLGVSWLTRAAETGNVEGMFRLGTVLINDLGRREDGITWLKAAAKKGHETSMCILAEEISDEAPSKARKWLKRAASNPLASVSLGHMYLAGVGCAVDVEAGIHLIRKAAKLNPEACDVPSDEDLETASIN